MCYRKNGVAAENNSIFKFERATTLQLEIKGEPLNLNAILIPESVEAITLNRRKCRYIYADSGTEKGIQRELVRNIYGCIGNLKTRSLCLTVRVERKFCASRRENYG